MLSPGARATGPEGARDCHRDPTGEPFAETPAEVPPAQRQESGGPSWTAEQMEARPARWTADETHRISRTFSIFLKIRPQCVWCWTACSLKV